MSNKNDAQEWGFESTDYEILCEASNLVDSSYSYFSACINQYRNDYNFMFVDQWTGDLRSVRTNKRKQVLQMNYLNSFCQQIIGEEVSNNPDVIVRPDSNVLSADGEHAELLEGLIRKIWLDNRVQNKKVEAFKNGVYGGFGVLKVDYDYESPYTFNKKIIITNIADPTNAFFDPLAVEPSKRDAEFCGHFDTLTKEEFWKLYPDAKSDLSFSGVQYISGQWRELWGTQKLVRICNLWRKEYYTETIVLLSNGESMEKSKAEKLMQEQDTLLRKMRKNMRAGVQYDESLSEKITIVDERTSTNCYKIIYYKLIADEILECCEWPIKSMPLIFLDHDSVLIEGAQRTRSYHHIAHDSQRYLNYLASQSADDLMNMHKGNWLANPEQMDGDILNLWLSPQNDKGILIAKKDSDGQMPQYVPPPNISSAYEGQYDRTVKDIQNIIGRFDAGRGQEDNAISGRAVNFRAMFGNLGSIIPFENLKATMVQLAQVTLELIPVVYDTMRAVAIKPRKGDERQVTINLNTPSAMKNDMTKEGYSVTIESGVSFAAQRAAAMAQLNSLISANPTLAPVLSDLIAENVDLPNAPQVVERIQKMLLGIPIPQIIAEETGQQPPPQQPNPEAQMAMQLQMEEMANKKAQTQNDAVRNQIDSQKLMNEAVDSHAKTVTSMMSSKDELAATNIKAVTEIRKAAIDASKRENNQ